MTSHPTGYPQTPRPTCAKLANSSLFKCQGLFCQQVVQGNALARRPTARAAAAHLPDHGSRWRRHWFQTYSRASECVLWPKCSFAGGWQHDICKVELCLGLPPLLLCHDMLLLLPACLLVMVACAQGHLNLIPTLLSQTMVEPTEHRGHIITLDR